MIIGYTTGVFDLFHIGHLNILRAAKELCDILIVGVSTDELVLKYKKKRTVISFEDRIEIIRSIKYVDVVIPQRSIDKVEAFRRLKFNILIVGDDWYNTDKWNKAEQKLKQYKVKVIYLPYTSNISSTKLRNTIRRKNKC